MERWTREEHTKAMVAMMGWGKGCLNRHGRGGFESQILPEMVPGEHSHTHMLTLLAR